MTNWSRQASRERFLPCALTLTIALGNWACEAPPDTQSSPATSAFALDALDEAEIARFQQGAREFSEVESAAEGLGPFFNGSSCGHCHLEGGLGGGGVMRVTRVMCKSDAGDLDEPTSGSLLHVFSTRPDLAAPGIPNGCDAVTSSRRTTNLLGAGLIEAIDDAEILAEELAQQEGVSGRAAIVSDPASGLELVGRFGWKAQHATLDSFAADAYRSELGITNELFRDEIAPGGDVDLLAAMDGVPDPEAGVGAVAALADFMRFSAPPPAGAEPERGAALFRNIGCASCHRESYSTRSNAGSLAGRNVRLYSDLLLHDVGTGDGIPQSAALPGELRTPPLWGLGRASLLLHDGSASSIDSAVMAHAGQASESQQSYAALSESERRALLEFLNSL
jgi:CxxC motif-containing protein (DUF1111 family)